MSPTVASQEQSLRTVCLTTLREVPKDLNFPLGGHRISYEGLQSIANDIQNGSLGVRYFDPKSPPEDKFGMSSVPMALVLRPNTVAWYAPEHKQLTLTRQPTSVPDKAALIHECVHALLHKQGGIIRNRTNECAAYIAEGWFLWRSNYVPPANDKRARLTIRTAQTIYVMLHTDTLSNTNSAFKAFKEKNPQTWRDLLEKKLKQLYDALGKNLQVDYDDLDEVTKQPMY